MFLIYGDGDFQFVPVIYSDISHIASSRGLQSSFIPGMESIPLHISNIAIFNPEKNKADRVGFRFNESGNKVRYFKSDGTLIDS